MIKSVPVKNLSLSNDNVRKTNRDADIAGLAANIAAHGLLQNLVVTPLKKANHFTVKAGGRRLRALQQLITAGTLPASHEIQVLVLDDDALSVEASLSENFHRVPMNPADECTAFKHFIDQGAAPDDVAKRFGVTTRFVEQRIRLADLAPAIFKALAQGEITLGAAQAYAVTANTDLQARVFASMGTAYHGDNPDAIRRAILQGSVKATDAKARFVGRDAYLAAGGAIENDLFGSADDESWTNPEILETLVSAKLEEEAAALIKEQGFAFVTPIAATHVPYDQERKLHEYIAPPRPLTEEETALVDALATENDALVEQLETELEQDTPEADAAEARLDAIEAELDRLDAARRVIPDEIKAQLGTFVYIGNDGTPRYHARMFSEKPILKPAVLDGDGNATGGAASDGDDSQPDNGARLSNTLIDELATQRRQILVAHIASDPTFALDLSIFVMANRIATDNLYVRDNITLSARAAQLPVTNFRDEGSAASNTIAEQRQALDTSWAAYDTLSERFDAFRTLDDQTRAAWLAYAVAQTLEATLNVADGNRENGFHDHLGRLLDIDVAQWWRPTADNYFGRVKRDTILDALEEIGGPILRGRYKDGKKAEVAAAASSLCNGQGIVEAEIRDAAIAWLPAAMRFDGTEKPHRNARIGTAFRPHAEDDEDQSAGPDDHGNDDGDYDETGDADLNDYADRDDGDLQHAA